jgi:CDP-paratose 2-epimerase
MRLFRMSARHYSMEGFMSTKHVLITGGAGFIGCNAARYFGQRNWQVTVLDNLSRVGTESNLTWLKDETEFEFAKVDVRDTAAVNKVDLGDEARRGYPSGSAGRRDDFRDRSPRMDFDVNALGTFNLLDAVRRFRPDTAFLFASTNKVYGKINGATSELKGSRYAYTNRPHGIPESEPLDFPVALRLLEGRGGPIRA